MSEFKLRIKMLGWGIVAMFLCLLVIAGLLSMVWAMFVGPSGFGMILAGFGFAICLFVVDPTFAAMIKTLEYEEQILALRFLNANVQSDSQ